VSVRAVKKSCYQAKEYKPAALCEVPFNKAEAIITKVGFFNSLKNHLVKYFINYYFTQVEYNYRQV
jgi:hypothetical protein